MSRFHTVISVVLVMVLVAGCMGGSPASPTNESPADEGGNEDVENVVTYASNEGNGEVIVTVNHDSETVDIVANTTLESTDNLTREITIATLCKTVHETVYNESATQMDLAQNVSYTKTDGNGNSESVDGIDESVFDYDAGTLEAHTHADNGSVMDSCAISGEDNFNYS